MKLAFLVCGIIELIGAAACSFFPTLIFAETAPLISKMYGLSASVIGIVSLLAYRDFSPAPLFRHLLVLMMFFHGALAMLCFKASAALIPYHLPATIVHLAMFVILLFGYMSNVKPLVTAETE